MIASRRRGAETTGLGFGLAGREPPRHERRYATTRTGMSEHVGSFAPATGALGQTPGLVDPFGRHVTYLRVSVTDRCDFRCTYCMSEHMTFLPRKDLLTLEELDRV